MNFFSSLTDRSGWVNLSFTLYSLRMFLRSWWLYEIFLWFCPLSSLNVFINYSFIMYVINKSLINSCLSFPFFWSTPVFIHFWYWRIHNGMDDSGLRILGKIVKKCLGILGSVLRYVGTKTVSDKQVTNYDSFNPYTCIIPRVKRLSTPPCKSSLGLVFKVS